MREFRLLEQNKKKRRLEDYMNKVEARNNELQHTVRTLERRISILEHDGVVTNASESINQAQKYLFTFIRAKNRHEYMKQNSNNQSYSRLASETFQSLNNGNTYKLVAGVRDQVTSFILNRVFGTNKHVRKPV